jgi:phosphate uptake regulator
MMKVRKLQLVGGSSYMVSLPKDWISMHNLQQGDEVILRELDEFIVLQPQKGKREEIKVLVQKIPRYDPKFMKRFIEAIYSLGVDKIIIEDEKIGEFVTDISEISHRYIGVEVLDVAVNRIVLHCFTIPDFDVLTIIKRMFQIIDGLLGEIERAMMNDYSEEEFVSFEKRIRRYEEDLDRLYLLAVRLVNRGMKKIVISEWDELRFLLGSRMVAKFLEEISDLLLILSKYLKDYDLEVRNKLVDPMMKLDDAFRSGFNSFSTSNIEVAEEFIEKVEQINIELQNYIREDKDGDILKELMLQICRMLESIGEISFNKSVRELFSKISPQA